VVSHRAVIPNVLAASAVSTPAFSGEDPENSRVSMMRYPTDSATVKMAAGSERRVGDHQGYHGQQDQRGRET
jgi:hypothetical protein